MTKTLPKKEQMQFSKKKKSRYKFGVALESIGMLLKHNNMVKPSINETILIILMNNERQQTNRLYNISFNTDDFNVACECNVISL